MKTGTFYIKKRNIFLLLSAMIIGVVIPGCQSNEKVTPVNTPDNVDYEKNDKIIRLANGNWPPYNGESLPEGGCDSKVVQETFGLAGYEVEFGYFPWARSYSLSATGEWDGTIAWDDTPSHREDHWISSEPTSVQEWVFFYRKEDDFSWDSMNDLYGKTIGITTGYVYSDAFSDLPDDSVTFLESTTDEANLKMLLSGRIDVFPMEKEVGLYLLRNDFSTDEQNAIAFNKKPISEFNSYLLLSKAIPENKARIEEFDQAFQKLIESDRYDEIMAQCNQTGE